MKNVVRFIRGLWYQSPSKRLDCVDADLDNLEQRMKDVEFYIRKNCKRQKCDCNDK